ncbi:MAG: MATE family efflux transporter [Desulfobacterales bacterium]
MKDIDSDQANQMGEKTILRLLIQFSLPTIAGMSVQAIYYTADRIFIGHALGPLGIAGLTVSFPITMIGFGLMMLIGTGGTALISLGLGEKNIERAEKVLGISIVLFVCSSLIFTLVGSIFLDPLLVFVGASETILPYARDYVQIMLLGTVFTGLGFGMNNFLRGEGNPRVAMIIMVIGAVLNIILDAVFILGFRMGMRGAAIAALIAQSASSAMVLYYYISGKSLLKIHLENLKPQWDIVRRILAIGFAPFSMMLMDSVMSTIWNRQLGTFGGDLAISVMGIVSSINMFFMFPLFGLSQGSQPLLGFNYGARKIDRVKKTLLLTIIVATTISVVGFLVTLSFPIQLIRIFNRDSEILIELGTGAMRIYFLSLPFMGYSIVASNYFQAVGKARQALFLILARSALLQLPVILILPNFMGLNGVWMSAPVSMIGATLLTGIWQWFEMKSLNRTQADLDPGETFVAG